MKYIRTKDGKIKIEYRRFTTHNGKVLVDTADEDFFYEESQILKQADTIEELCDEIIGILNKNIECERYETSLRIGDKLWFDDLEDAQYNKKYCSEIYGAIWTDKGLIYVAKMNDKGELELL